jgi:uncharacterized membrane protein
MDGLRLLVVQAALLGCGLMTGLFFAFSISIMNAWARVSDQEGIRAMQSINIAIVNPVFLIVFLGVAFACVGAVVISLTNWSQSGSGYMMTGGLLYLVGGLLVTAVFNIPRNNMLAALDPESESGIERWREYRRSWTAWNHVRGIAAFLASVAFMLALRA